MNLRIQRFEQKITQRELSARSGVAHKTIANIEANSINASLDLIDKLADALGCPAHQLLAPPHKALLRVANLKPKKL